MKNVSLKNMKSTFGFDANTYAGILPKNPIKFNVQDGKIVEGELPEPADDTVHVVSALVFNALRETRSDIAMWDPNGKDDSGVYHSLILADGSIAAITE